MRLHVMRLHLINLKPMKIHLMSLNPMRTLR